jgi:hypothetical protein
MGKMKSEPKAPRALNFHRSCHNDYLQLQHKVWAGRMAGRQRRLHKRTCEACSKKDYKEATEEEEPEKCVWCCSPGEQAYNGLCDTCNDKLKLFLGLGSWGL